MAVGLLWVSCGLLFALFGIIIPQLFYLGRKNQTAIEAMRVALDADFAGPGSVHDLRRRLAEQNEEQARLRVRIEQLEAAAGTGDARLGDAVDFQPAGQQSEGQNGAVRPAA